ncbi:DM13 domain-containing protein [Pleurocapsales cyanobacterium LEGE 06147]|nr:DM13 domain-containing protein [Pleurocapsales cyanobacterium LEGE 06147]
MKFKKHLPSLSLAAALLCTTVGSAFLTASAIAEPLNTQAQLVAVQEDTAYSFVTVEQDHQTTGTVKIIEENGQKYLEFDEDFTTANGPDVQVILYRDNSIPVNIEEADYIALSPLESFSGQQRYLIPEDINLKEYQAVGIWCQQFNVTFAYAALK